jgi:hypothetical protein
MYADQVLAEEQVGVIHTFEKKFLAENQPFTRKIETLLLK